MPKREPNPILSAGACLFLAAAWSATPVAAQSAPDAGFRSADVPAGVQTLLHAYEVGWANRDAETLARLFTEDGWALRPGASLVRGWDAIEDSYAGLGGPLVLRPYHFESEGDLGVLVGGYARYLEEPDLGKFVLALRQVDPGVWRIVADIDNGN